MLAKARVRKGIQETEYEPFEVECALEEEVEGSEAAQRLAGLTETCRAEVDRQVGLRLKMLEDAKKEQKTRKRRYR
jgi:hypothetical protein